MMMKPMLFMFLTMIWLLLLSSIEETYGDITFSREPEDAVVEEGSSVTLYCTTSEVATRVIWTEGTSIIYYYNNGEGTVYNSDSYTVEDSSNSFNLIITDISVSQGGTYTCQAHADIEISTEATITVLVPPDSLYIDDYEDGSIVTVTAGDQLFLSCRSDNGKPAADIEWSLNGLVNDDSEVDTVTSYDRDELTYDIVSTLTVTLEEADNDAVVSCRATHPAYSSTETVSLTLNVQYAPGVPTISGYTTGTAVVSGDTLTLACVSEGGNPVAQLSWYEGGQLIDDCDETTDSGDASCVIDVVVDVDDIDTVYECQASSTLLTDPLSASVTLAVYFAPDSVAISTSSQVFESGTDVVLSCLSTESNPAATLTWSVAGTTLTPSSERTYESTSGGYITQQNVTIAISSDDNESVYTCEAWNDEVDDGASETFTLSVQYSPDDPTIIGYTAGTILTPDSNLRLTCRSSGGNPLADLNWYLDDDDDILDADLSQSLSVVTSDLQLVIEASHNDAVYTCEASNVVNADTPSSVSVVLSVYFAPETVTIVQSPETVYVDDTVTLTCTSASSNPVAEITWWKNGIQLTGSEGDDAASLYGGISSSSQLIIGSISSSSNGAMYTCEATNTELSSSASDGLSLDVLYAPEFIEFTTLDQDENVVSVEAGDTVVIDCATVANPDDITYTWFLNDVSIASYSSSQLTIEDTVSSDSAVYTCKAQNSVGLSEVDVTLNVLYAPLLTLSSSDVYVTAGSTLEVTCQVDANPLPDAIIWLKDDETVSYTTELTDNSNMLTISSLTSEDSGTFTCYADNSVGSPSTLDISIIVKYSVEVDDTSTITKVAVDTGDSAVLTCVMYGAPDVGMEWTMVSSDTEFTINYDQLTSDHFQSTLTLSSVTDSDYGRYLCVGTNDLGTNSVNITLMEPTTPEAPTDLKVTNTSYNTAILEWEASFDGGITQSYVVEYSFSSSTTGDQSQMIYNVGTHTSYTVTGLQALTSYKFAVYAFNDLGMSSPSNVVEGTTGEQPISTYVQNPNGGQDELPFYLIVILGGIAAVFLLCNIILVACVIKRRRNQPPKKKGDTPKLVYTVNPQRNDRDDADGSVEMYDRDSRKDFFCDGVSVNSAEKHYMSYKDDFDEMHPPFRKEVHSDDEYIKQQQYRRPLTHYNNDVRLPLNQCNPYGIYMFISQTH